MTARFFFGSLVLFAFAGALAYVVHQTRPQPDPDEIIRKKGDGTSCTSWN